MPGPDGIRTEIDDDGDGIIDRIKFDPDGDGNTDRTLHYDADGNVTRLEWDRDDDGTIDRIQTYNYDGNGNRIRTRLSMKATLITAGIFRTMPGLNWSSWAGVTAPLN